jgi:uncharacterized protein YceK
MKHKTLVCGIVICLLLSACGTEQIPTLNALDVQGTAQSAAFTMVAETQQSIPTFTPLPPTETPSPIPSPTETQPPSPTIDPSLPTGTVTIAPQSSSAPTQQDNCNKLLSAWQGPTAKFQVTNETKPKGTIVLSMYVVTDLGECGNIVAYDGSFSGPVGNYSAAAFVTGKKDFKVFGGFRVNQGSWNIIVRNDSIVAKGGCYPDC